MIPIDTMAIFVAATVALALAPGPDNIFVLTQSALYGRSAGFFVTLGLCTGLLAHTAAVSLGVAAIFQTSAAAFNTLKLLGALYLLFLAWQAFRAGATDIPNNGEEGTSLPKLYRRGIIMNITNPKVAIFFLAFLPQFVDPAEGSITLQTMLFGVIFIAVALVVFGSISWSAGFLGEWLRKSARAQKILNRMAGLVFVGLAVKLASTER